MQSTNERKLLVGTGSLALALAVATAVLGREVHRLHTRGHVNLQAVLDDPESREQVIRILVDRGANVYDTHNDPDVARVMQPGIRGRGFTGASLDSNAFGMREREYELPKPEGIVRVVLLGDSFVVGHGVEAEDRLGVFLDRFLTERALGFTGEIEVLHLATSSWNVIAECSYARRQLGLLRPDLVVQITCGNDLDDTFGTRGFGGMSRFTPQERARADAPCSFTHPVQFLGIEGASVNLMAAGRDDESRRRYARAADEVARLRRGVHAIDGRYLMVLHWGFFNPAARELLAGELDPAEVAYLSADFRDDETFWNSLDDGHWNAAGMRVVALMLYGLIRERDLLPELDLPPWSEAEEAVRLVHENGVAEGTSPRGVETWVQNRTLDDRLDMRALTTADAPHFNGGIDRDGLVSPYASLTLRVSSPGRLRLLGSSLGRPELDGTAVRVSLDELPLGSFELHAGRDIDESWPLPPEALERGYVTVRMRADDYAYVGDDLQHCVVFRLERLFVE